MAKKKATPKQNGTLVKIAETIGEVVGRISVTKDELADKASHAVEVIKEEFKSLSGNKTKKAVVKKLVPKKAAVKSTAKKATPKKATAKKAVVKKSAVKKSAVKKSPVKKVAPKKAARRAGRASRGER